MDRYQVDWEVVPQGARLLRMRGPHPYPVLPEQIEGIPLKEIGDYCFAPEGRLPGQYRTTDIQIETSTKVQVKTDVTEETAGHLSDLRLREICGSYLERLVLPESLERIGKYAFYNCKRLASVSMGKHLTEIGSDAFMNCHNLKEIHLKAMPEEKTGARQVLAQVSLDMEVFFETEECHAALFFPEYYESYDEIAPAHIFGRGIVGEGFRARQCFHDGVLDLKQYDLIFPQACVGENEETLCKLAWNRLRYPNGLEESPRRLYIEYLREHGRVLLARLVREKNSIELKQLGDMGFIDREEIDECIRMAAAAGWAKGAAKLLHMKNLWFPVRSAKSRYTFEEF